MGEADMGMKRELSRVGEEVLMSWDRRGKEMRGNILDETTKLNFPELKKDEGFQPTKRQDEK